MNKNNETYSYLSYNLNIDTTQPNNYSNYPLNNNYIQKTFNNAFFPKTNTILIYNLKNNIRNNYSRNCTGRNYIYNQKKVISLHKNIKTKKEKNWKTFDYESLYKNINSIHKNALKNKLFQSKIYKLLQKTANENYLKRKKEKKTFITTIDEYNKDKIKNNINNNIGQKKLKKLSLDLTSSYNIKEPDTIKTPIKNTNMNYLLLNLFNSGKSKTLDNYKLTDISLPCIRFNNSLNSLNTNPNHKNSVAKTSLAKLKIDIINKELNESYQTFFEKRDFPIKLTDNMIIFYKKSEKYFLIYDDLLKRYLQFLELETKNNLIKLDQLIKDKEKLLKENEETLKKISNVEKQIKIFESFNNLYLNLKNKANKLSPSSPIKSPTKSKNSNQFKSPNVFKRNFTISLSRRTSKVNKVKNSNRRGSMIIKKKTRNSIDIKQNPVDTTPKKARELFKNTQEIKEIFEERDRNVFKAYKKYVDVIYDLSELSLNHQKEKENKNIEIIDTNNLIEKLKNELILLKVKNKDLINYKKFIIAKKIKEEKEINEDINTDIFKIITKVKSILLNQKINLEKFLNIKNLYEILKSKEISNNIFYKGKVYSSEIFYLKVLESLYLKIELWRNKCMKDKNLREKYIKIKTERDKEIKYLKCEQKLIEDKFNKMKKNEEIMNKNTKVIVLRNKKFDPFYKKYIADKIIKKRLTSKEHLNRLKLENENDKYNYLYY